MWYGSWILMIGSGAALFIAKTMAERLIFGGLFGVGITTAVCAASWALIIGTATA
jgi:hypothetical protein